MAEKQRRLSRHDRGEETATHKALQKEHGHDPEVSNTPQQPLLTEELSSLTLENEKQQSTNSRSPRTHNNQSTNNSNTQSSSSSSAAKLDSNVYDRPAVYPATSTEKVTLYEPLAEHQYRLIQFRKIHATGIPIYRMCTFELCDEPPPYCGVSYCWGPLVFQKRIICNKHFVHVSENLYLGLQRLQEVGPLYLWVDQICINQSDDTERAKQVLLMGKLYSRAIRTLVWLGPAGPLVNRDTFKYVEAMWEAHMRESAPFDECGITSAGSFFRQVELAPERLGLPSDGSDDWNALSDLLNRPWYTRVWALQELALSQADPIFICGDMLIGFTKMYLGIRWFTSSLIDGRRRLGRSALQMVNGLRGIDIFDISQSIRTMSSDSQCEHRSWRLPHLIDTILSLEATDDRDMVYGLLGLTEYATSDATLPEFLIPDYSIDPYLLYGQIALYSIKENRNLRIFREAGLYDRAAVKSDPCKLETPSWTPRLNMKGRRPCSMSFRTSWQKDVAPDGFVENRLRLLYHASAWLPAETISSDDLDVLTLKGLRLDRVKAVLPTIAYGNTNRVDYSSPRLLEFWEAGLKNENLDDSSPDEVLQDFALRFFSLVFIFDNHSFVCQSLSLINQQALNKCWGILLFAYAVNASRVGAAAKIEKYLSFAAGENEPEFIFYHANKAPFITDRGYFGFGPAETHEGDCIFVLFGGHHPYLLEQCGSEYHLVGEAAVREYMEGQAIDAWKKGEIEEQWVRIH